MAVISGILCLGGIIFCGGGSIAARISGPSDVALSMCVYFPRFALNRGGCSHAHTCKRRVRGLLERERGEGEVTRRKKGRGQAGGRVIITSLSLRRL